MNLRSCLLHSGRTWSLLEYPMQAFTFLGSELFFLLVMPALSWSIEPVIGFRAGMMLILSGGLNSVFKMLFHTPRPFWVDADVKVFRPKHHLDCLQGTHRTQPPFGNHRCNNPRKMGVHRRDRMVFLLVSRAYILGFTSCTCTYRVAGRYRDHPGLPDIRDSIAKWLIGKSLGVQLLLSFLFGVSFIVLGVLARASASNWTLPQEWINTALAAGAEQPDPFNLEGVVTIAGVAFGFTSGYAVWRHLYGVYEIRCSSIKTGTLRFWIAGDCCALFWVEAHFSRRTDPRRSDIPLHQVCPNWFMGNPVRAVILQTFPP